MIVEDREDRASNVSAEFRDLVAGALEGAAGCIECGGVDGLAGILLFWMPDAQLVFDRGVMDVVLPDPPSADPATWFDRFTTTGADRADS